jgi:pilus assembly protein CpaC
MASTGTSTNPANRNDKPHRRFINLTATALVGIGALTTLRAAPPTPPPAPIAPATTPLRPPIVVPDVSSPPQGLPPAVVDSLVPISPVAAPQPMLLQPPVGVPRGNPLPQGPMGNSIPAPPSGAGLQPSQTTREKMAKYVSKLIDPETTLDLIAGQTRVLVFKDAPFRIQAGNEQVLGFNPPSPRELMLHGKTAGATVLTIWFGDRSDPAKQETLSYLVRVFPDPEAKERQEKAYKALEDDINRHFRDTSVKLKVVGDKLLVSGRVRDFVQGAQILQIIRASGPPGGSPPAAAGPSATPEPGTIPIIPAGGIQASSTNVMPTAVPQTMEAFQAAGGPNVINLLEVAGEQQVMLRVIVAEVNRAAARSVGMNFSVQNNQGLTVFANATGFAAGFTGIGGSTNLLGAGPPNVFARFDAGRIPVAIHALKTLQYAKSMAEPTLVTMNGQTANFLAGGQFPVPIIGGFNGLAGGLQGVSYIPFGVQLSFTPFLTDRDKVRLVLSANVSSRDTTTGSAIAGTAVPGLNTRNLSTTVELRQGETLAVAGLIETTQSGDKNNVPFLGDVPGLNVLTGLQRVQATERELVIFITPELARPMEPGQAAPLPGCEILDPNDVELYLMGRIEGHCRDYRSPIRTDLSRIRMYSRTESVNVHGPSGYTPLP